MPRLTNRDQAGPSRPLSGLATGEWFRRKGTRTVLQRYDEAPPHDGTTHWYLDVDGWHAYRAEDMIPTKAPKRAK